MTISRRSTSAPPPGPPQTQLQALQRAIPELLDVDPAQALALAQTCCALAGTPGSSEAAESQVLLGRALLASGQQAEALAAFCRSTEHFERLDQPIAGAEAHSLAGKLQLDLGRFDEAAWHLEQAVRLAQNEPEGQGIQATALNHLAIVNHHQGRVTEALGLLHQALQLREDEQHVTGQIHCLINISNIQMWFGQYDEAVRSLTRAYTLYKTQPADLKLETPILHNLAHVHSMRGDNDLAIEVMEAAYKSAVGSGDRRMQATASLNLGMCCLDAQQFDRALEYLQLALKLSRELRYQVGELSALDSLGNLYSQTGELALASQTIREALVIALEIGSKQGELEVRLQLGRLHLRQGELDAAHQELNAALELAVGIQSVKEQAEAHEALAEYFERRGSLAEALTHSRELTRIERELFNAERDRQTRNLSIQFEVERARHDAEIYRVRTDVEHEGRQRAEEQVRVRTAELARAQQEVVTRLAMAAEYRDDTTGEHTRRVGRTSARIALALGWPEGRANVLGIAARLHDVGKIGIPDSVLLKSGKLDSAEFRQMQTHTLIGARILSGGRSELLRLAEEIALTHHERWDGSGYPRGLQATQIPLSGRIVALADVFDALTQVRPYKAAWSTQEALDEIRRQTGSHFDPDLVETAVEVLTQPDTHSGDWGEEPLPLEQEDASHVLTVFEQLLVERTRELEQARQEAERLALTDSLTELGNRRALEQRLERTLRQSAESRAPFTVLSFDLDGLKAVNDAQGHAQGDRFLQAFALSLTQAFGEAGLAYRIGGDEFAIVTTQPLDEAALRDRLGQVHEQLRCQGFEDASASMGHAQYPQDAQTAGDLLRLSDQRMYHRKLSRRRGMH
ncbi:HD domain-containing phosphohydrolase [Deinococcus radiopugnans]|uniref:Diguanylate cyclase (GGDEF)-like protein n=1 Tax=Deinococcus radiopugnans ATCC 19172 TaxID=585398 RepID=A0A5C4YA80_9DEIO|nr:HD domain-containing phosphohydrolase [Deinococcus radiopugnans]MBB6015492.1 diguanylate cyclase (GGDEF)-like protein [Deinococcus radiopugnans ATCC 19172]TNM72790.1 tetratricopeptide repeat protein [Deinococcus radiopugnans ATCC 19172]